MQDLSGLEKTISGLAKSLQTGGVLVLLAIVAVLAYLLIMAWMKNRKATQSVNVNLGKPTSSYDAGRIAVMSNQLNGLTESAAVAVIAHVDQANKLARIEECGKEQTAVLGRMDNKLAQLVIMEKLRNGFSKDIDIETLLK